MVLSSIRVEHPEFLSDGVPLLAVLFSAGAVLWAHRLKAHVHAPRRSLDCTKGSAAMPLDSSLPAPYYSAQLSKRRDSVLAIADVGE
jgi:hypothetical protein